MFQLRINRRIIWIAPKAIYCGLNNSTVSNLKSQNILPLYCYWSGKKRWCCSSKHLTGLLVKKCHRANLVKKCHSANVGETTAQLPGLSEIAYIKIDSHKDWYKEPRPIKVIWKWETLFCPFIFSCGKTTTKKYPYITSRCTVRHFAQWWIEIWVSHRQRTAKLNLSPYGMWSDKGNWGFASSVFVELYLISYDCKG